MSAVRADRALGVLLGAVLLAACQVVEIVPTPRPLPDPTPAPVVAPARVAPGDDLAAIAVLGGRNPDLAPLTRAELLTLAAAQLRRQRYADVLTTLATFPAATPADALDARAIWMTASAHAATGNTSAARAGYAAYIVANAPLTPYAQLRHAQLIATGDPARAAEDLRSAATSEIAPAARADAYERAITLAAAQGQLAAALALTDELLALAQIPAYRVTLLLRAATLAEQVGDTTRASTWLAEAAAIDAPEALQALDRLVQIDPARVDPVRAADLYTTAERAEDALRAYDAAIVAANDPLRRDLRRRRALVQREVIGQQDAALAELAAIAAATPDDEPGRQAQLDWIQTLGQRGDRARALQGYLEYAAAYPDDPRAPEALRRAAVLQGRQDDARGQLAQLLDLAARYPQSPLARPALEAAAAAQLATGDASAARDTWLRAAAAAPPTLRADLRLAAAAAARAAGDEPGARALYTQLIAEDRGSFAAARAAVFIGQAPAGTRALDATLSQDDWRTLDTWIASWHPAGEGTVSAAASRAAELDAVGASRAARGEWAHALATTTDPPGLVALAQQAYAAGNTRAALDAADQIAAFASVQQAAPAPVALDVLRYPAPFGTDIRLVANSTGVDPFVLLALMRRESRFDPDAVSWVGARGLTQVMPETGESIAQGLGDTAFTTDRLFEPSLAIRYGATYLADQLADSGGRVERALAAYNAGPGAAQRWDGVAAGQGLDAYIAGIDYAETRGYVRAIIADLAVYRAVYTDRAPMQP